MNYIHIIQDDQFRESYSKIISELGYDSSKDIESRDKLLGLLNRKNAYSLEEQLDYLKKLIDDHKTMLILGGGPETSLFCEYLVNHDLLSELKMKLPLIIAIDGSTELLYNIGLFPHIIFTDLDGLTLPTSLKKPFTDSCFIIHAHGDNMDKIDIFQELIMNHTHVIGTTQVDSSLPVINHGGFTDGDRALFLLRNFITDSHTVNLIGYDFSDKIGMYSKPNLTGNSAASAIKSKKLEIGVELINKYCMNMKDHTQQLIIDIPSKLAFPQIYMRKPQDLSNWIGSI